MVLVLVWYIAGAKFGYPRDGTQQRNAAAQECLTVYVGGENVPIDDVKMSAEKAILWVAFFLLQVCGWDVNGSVLMPCVCQCL